MKSLLFRLLAVTSALIAGACAHAAPEPQPGAPLPSAEELAPLLVAYDVPGMAMATLTGCEMEGVMVAGVASLETGALVTPLTAFEAASLSKPIFAYLVLELVDEGIIDLDRPIAESFAYARIADEAGYARITPRMVLTHTTGLPNWVDERTAFHERTAPIPFEAEPGTTHTYSGEAFQLLQAFVEARTGMSLQALFEARLGNIMPNSTFAQPLPAAVVPSRGYRSASEPASGRAMTSLRARGMAAASLATTAEDYARFLSHVCREGGLRPATYADMLTPQSLTRDDGPVPTAYGLGWMIAEIPEGTIVGHGGNNNEYRAFGGFIRESGDGIVILTNSATGQALIDVLITPEE
jgi:CubicO group peptidase (beta-lactamase class C family)